jgi:hypothetical protein
VARAVWLGVFCLLGIGPFIFVKVVTGTSAQPLAADIVDAMSPPSTAYLQEDILAKADRLPVFKQADTRQASTVSLATAAPAHVVQRPIPDPPTIVGRHWHKGDSFQDAKRRPSRRLTGKKRAPTIASSAHAGR